MGDQASLYESMVANATQDMVTPRERDALDHFLGDRNTVQSDWEEVRPTLPNEWERAEQEQEEEEAVRSRL